MMPKGVEHTYEELGSGGKIKVIRPLMPKGVEHLNAPASLPPMAGDPSVDAERR